MLEKYPNAAKALLMTVQEAQMWCEKMENREELAAICEHFSGLGRDPTDVELETLAQTWSEHCAHKTFQAAITVDGAEITPLLRQLRERSQRSYPAGGTAR